MPKFVTVSPTHVPAKKEYAWNNLKTGGYAATDWLENVEGRRIRNVIGNDQSDRKCSLNCILREGQTDDRTEGASRRS